MSKSMKKRLAELKYQEEIASLNSKISDTEQLLKEELKTRSKLKTDAATKTKDISSVDDAIALEEKLHRHKKPQFIDETKQLEAERRRKLSELQEKHSRLISDLAPFDLLERENAILQTRLSGLLEEYHNVSQFRESLKEDRKQQNFDVRMMMDVTLRKRLEELNTDYQLKASKKLEMDAAKANMENLALGADIQVLEEKSRHLISEQQDSYDQLRRLHIEHEVISVTADIQEQKVAQLVHHTSKEQRALGDLAEYLRAMELEIIELQRRWEVKSNSMSDLNNLEQSLKDTSAKRSKVQEAVIQFTQQLVLDTLDLSEIERQERSLRIISGLTKNSIHRRRELFARSLFRSSRSNNALVGATAAATGDGKGGSFNERKLQLMQSKRSMPTLTPISGLDKEDEKDPGWDFERVWKSTYGNPLSTAAHTAK